MMLARVLDAASIGGLAGEALSRPGNAIVVASFERSFYLDVGGTLITIGDVSLHDGPRNVRLDSKGEVGLTAGLAIETGQRWTVTPKRLRRHDYLELDFRHARIWQPERLGQAPDHAELKRGLDHLHALLGKRDLEESGLIGLVLHDPPPRTATECAAKPHIEALKADLPHWLSDDAPPDYRPAIQLLGLGPGLTPSGDDLLAGILIAWHHLGVVTGTDRLGSDLLAAAAARTTPISQAHLTAATQGYGASPLHHLLNAVIADRRALLAEALDAAAKIGHSSGLDAIAGMVLALTAWLKADR